jgi:hypothetical protein
LQVLPPCGAQRRAIGIFSRIQTLLQFGNLGLEQRYRLLRAGVLQDVLACAALADKPHAWKRISVDFMRPNIPSLRAIAIGIAALVGLIILFSLLVRVTRIEAGHVGVEINLAG